MDQKKTPLWAAIFRHDSRDEGKATLDFLRATPLFHSLGKRELRSVADIAHHRTYQPGEFVFQKGQPGAAMFIIRSGEVEVIAPEGPDQETAIATLGAGTFFGELALLDDSPRSATVRARSTAEIYAFFRTDLERLLNNVPQIGLQVYRALALIIGSRLKEANAQLSHQ